MLFYVSFQLSPCSDLFHCVHSFRNEPTTSRCDRSGTVQSWVFPFTQTRKERANAWVNVWNQIIRIPHTASSCRLAEVRDSVNMTSTLGVSFHSRQLCQKAKYRWGKNEVTKNMNQEKPVEEVFFGNLRFANEKTSINHKCFHTTTNIAAVGP